MKSKFSVVSIYLFIIGVNSIEDGNISRQKRSNEPEPFIGELKQIYMPHICTSVSRKNPDYTCKIYDDCCPIHGDCCKGHDSDPNEIELQMQNITDKIPISILERDVEERFGCLALFDVKDFKRQGIIDQRGFSVINWCPTETEPELKIKCERPHSFNISESIFDLPAHSIDSKITYANIYCGQCHEDTNFAKYSVYLFDYNMMVPFLLDLKCETIELWVDGRIAKLALENFDSIMNYTGSLTFKENIVMGLDTYYLQDWHMCRTNSLREKCKEMPSEYIFMYNNFCRDSYFIDHNNFILNPSDQFCKNGLMMEKECYERVTTRKQFRKPEFIKQEIPGIKYILDSDNITYTYIDFQRN